MNSTYVINMKTNHYFKLMFKCGDFKYGGKNIALEISEIWYKYLSVSPGHYPP